MEYIIATEENAEEIYIMVRDIITTIYPRFYPQKVVDFFHELHSKENILKDIKESKVSILVDAGKIVGTGSYDDDHITRVYVNPKYQNQGYGSYIMQRLEKDIAIKFKFAYLDSSLPACCLYEKRGYITQQHKRWGVGDDVVLIYEVMRKELNTEKSELATTDFK